LLTIRLGEEELTLHEDAWSGSLQPAARVSAYPLAMWVASSWWRLRWEAEPFRNRPALSWQMSHCLPAAGHGFLWPP
jgi:hypothetical protein